MCQSHNPRRIDPCIKNLMKHLKKYGNRDCKPIASCCGHGRYPMSIVIRPPGSDGGYEILSQKFIKRRTRFYKKDRKGFYFIPEVCKEKP